MIATTGLTEKYSLIVPPKTKNRIGIATTDGIKMIDISSILRVEACRSYATIYYNKQQKLLVSRPLKKLEDALPKNLFFRVHHSHLVNIEHISKVSRENGGTIILSDESRVPISRRRIKDLSKALLG